MLMACTPPEDAEYFEYFAGRARNMSIGAIHPVEFVFFVPYFKVETGAVAVGRVAEDEAEGLAGFHFLSLTHFQLAQSGVDGEVSAMAYEHHIVVSVHDNHHRYHTGIYGCGVRTGVVSMSMPLFCISTRFRLSWA